MHSQSKKIENYSFIKKIYFKKNKTNKKNTIKIKSCYCLERRSYLKSVLTKYISTKQGLYFNFLQTSGEHQLKTNSLYEQIVNQVFALTFNYQYVFIYLKHQ
ncbi:hypothetical protein TTHERM_000126879 (macronuclear) [Tetrahymena thermophila SB210]|uniref:Uncharacterized protein n=1 Tax=Tetrahymena thermophila (strain SB210) TaxID=312017 RepID=W7XAH6_TETTS|nr:hypothetical protein TTHERM_000126879 [Tetrahymena thermophila SB210]EWS74337.1 hypothetical protein TTHERM_000126879 [Tetrahymena thermophila SB210]|eukprot:XP_012653158.1 hypothetical protein TTHERM_000126879 [Tetrahymena thermophila SB210]